MRAPSERVRIVVKKAKGHGGHHGGAWKVAYADFVTAMMALFIVLWLLTQADLRTRSQIARYFRDPGILTGGAVTGNPQSAAEVKLIQNDISIMEQRAQQAARQKEQQALEAEGKRLREMLEKAVGGSEGGDAELSKLKDLVEVKVTDAGLLIEVVDSAGAILFDRSSAELKPPLVELLRRIAATLGTLPNDIEIGGHTDSQPFMKGATKTNWDLSYERAAAAQRVLEGNGLRSGQVRRILAHADSDLYVKEDPMDPRNRRLSILAARRLTGPTPEKPLPDEAPPPAVPAPTPTP